jgi:hypothetical protein
MLQLEGDERAVAGASEDEEGDRRPVALLDVGSAGIRSSTARTCSRLGMGRSRRAVAKRASRAVGVK